MWSHNTGNADEKEEKRSDRKGARDNRKDGS